MKREGMRDGMRDGMRWKTNKEEKEKTRLFFLPKGCRSDRGA
jgi:hypothetical protein